MKACRHILLTGAGFTKDYGGYLGAEMWSVIFNQGELRHYPRLRRLMLNQFDYEQAYSDVTTSTEYSEEERAAFTRAVYQSYREMDESICTGPQRVSHANLLFRGVVERFAALANRTGTKERGFIFTLNQDLFFERFYSSENFQIRIPGLSASNPAWFQGRQHSRSLTDEDWAMLPTEEELRRSADQFWNETEEYLAYIKLHGSYRWRSSIGPKAMVIGGEKASAIAREPLLNWYFSLFKEVLHRPDCSLVVVGYSFRDRHINAVILEGIEQYGLKLFVVSPQDPESFRSNFYLPSRAMPDFFGTSAERRIWEGLHGYFCSSAEGLYNGDRPFDLSLTGKTLFRNIELA